MEPFHKVLMQHRPSDNYFGMNTKRISIKNIKEKLRRKSVTFSVRMDESLKKQIDQSAKKNGVTSNRLIKTVLEHYCSRQAG